MKNKEKLISPPAILTISHAQSEGETEKINDIAL